MIHKYTTATNELHWLCLWRAWPGDLKVFQCYVNKDKWRNFTQNFYCKCFAASKPNKQTFHLLNLAIRNYFQFSPIKVSLCYLFCHFFHLILFFSLIFCYFCSELGFSWTGEWLIPLQWWKKKEKRKLDEREKVFM